MSQQQLPERPHPAFTPQPCMSRHFPAASSRGNGGLLAASTTTLLLLPWLSPSDNKTSLWALPLGPAGTRGSVSYHCAQGGGCGLTQCPGDTHQHLAQLHPGDGSCSVLCALSWALVLCQQDRQDLLWVLTGEQGNTWGENQRKA